MDSKGPATARSQSSVIPALECLVHAQTLETMWTYYWFSDGKLYADKIKEAARIFVESFVELCEEDPRFIDAKLMGIGERSFQVKEILANFSEWIGGRTEMPYSTKSMTGLTIFKLVSGVKSILVKDDVFTREPLIGFHSGAWEFAERVVRWKGHIPQQALHSSPDELVRKASGARTIAVIADIRRSQDLMTYAKNPDDFSKRVVEFITTSRELIEKHFGFLDKFTGDGFVVYFNEAICASRKKNFVECFLEFCRDELAFCRPHFSAWERTIRKVPNTEIGLTIGADLGTVKFSDINHHLVAVGDAIVWAERMSSIGGAHEVVINNLLYDLLCDVPGVNFESRTAKTKSGEEFVARVMRFA
jgi:class 3 adenylate cyclase